MGEDGKPQNLSLHNSLSQAQKALVLRKVSDAGHEEQPAKAPKKASTKKQKAVERQKRNLNCNHPPKPTTIGLETLPGVPASP